MAYDQYILKIDSKDSVMKGRNPIELSFPNSSITNIVNITLKNASIPHVFYNISEINNVIEFISNEGGPFTYTWPVGHYTITSLLQSFNNSIVSTNYTSIKMSFNELTNKIMFTSPSDFTVDHNVSNNIMYNLGLDDTQDFFIIGANTTSALYMPDLAGVKNIYIESNLAQMNTIEVLGHRGYISNIPVTVPFASIIQYINQEMDLETVNRSVLYSQSLQNVVITLRDSHGRILNLQNVDWHINLKIIFKHD